MELLPNQTQTKEIKMCDICDALPYGACDSCAAKAKATPSLFTEVFGEDLLVTEVIGYSDDDYVGRSVVAFVRLPSTKEIRIVAPSDSFFIR
jgi:hypothetical protein